jgi:hypothetical protein
VDRIVDVEDDGPDEPSTNGRSGGKGLGRGKAPGPGRKPESFDIDAHDHDDEGVEEA